MLVVRRAADLSRPTSQAFRPLCACQQRELCRRQDRLRSFSASFSTFRLQTARAPLRIKSATHLYGARMPSCRAAVPKVLTTTRGNNTPRPAGRPCTRVPPSTQLKRVYAQLRPATINVLSTYRDYLSTAVILINTCTEEPDDTLIITQKLSLRQGDIPKAHNTITQPKPKRLSLLGDWCGSRVLAVGCDARIQRRGTAPAASTQPGRKGPPHHSLTRLRLRGFRVSSADECPCRRRRRLRPQPNPCQAAAPSATVPSACAVRGRASPPCWTAYPPPPSPAPAGRSLYPSRASSSPAGGGERKSSTEPTGASVTSVPEATTHKRYHKGEHATTHRAAGRSHVAERPGLDCSGHIRWTG